MFSEDLINRVRDSVDIHDLISGYVSLKKAGKNWLGLCPFHSEKTPSFNVNTEKQIFHCFGCGVGGDAFKFLELQEGLNFPEAVKQLATKAGIALPADTRSRQDDKRNEDERKALFAIMADAAAYFQRELAGPGGSAARAYLQKRGVTDRIVQEYSLGFARPEWDGLLNHLKRKGYQPGQLEKAGLIVKRSEGEGYYDRFRGRIIFPIRDIAGQVIAFGGRVMDDSLPKYLNSPETPLYSKSNVLYCLDRAKEPAKKLKYFIIVEGYLDALACHQYGAQNTVATLGTALTDGHLRLMRRFAPNLVLIFDPDAAGVKAAMRSAGLFASSGMKVNVVSIPGGDDPDTFLKKNGYDAFASCLKQSVKFMDFVLGQVVKGGQAAGIDEKVAQAGEMLEYIALLPSGIEQDHYIKKTAEALDLDEAVLRREMPHHTGRTRPDAAAVRASAPATSRPKAEETLIHLMLRDEETARRLQGQVQPADFTDPVFRRAAERVFRVLKEKGSLDHRALPQENDEELNRVLSHYAMLEITEENLVRASQDCVDIIQQRDPERKMKALVKAMQDAEAINDVDAIARLIEEQNELGKRPGRQHGKRVPGMKG